MLLTIFLTEIDILVSDMDMVILECIPTMEIGILGIHIIQWEIGIGMDGCMDTIHFIMTFIPMVGGAGQCHLVTEIGTLNMELM